MPDGGEDSVRKEYLEQRDKLDQVAQDASKSFDQAMLTLAAGSLGLSVTFVKEIAHTPAPYTRGWLYFAWFFFAASILSILGSFLASQFAVRAEVDRLDSDYEIVTRQRKRRRRSEPPSPAIRWVFRLDEKDNLWGNFVDRLNFWSIIWFISGAIFFIVFSATNLNGELNVAGPQTPEKKDDSEKRGYRPMERPVSTPAPKPATAPSSPPPKTK